MRPCRWDVLLPPQIHSHYHRWHCRYLKIYNCIFIFLHLIKLTKYTQSLIHIYIYKCCQTIKTSTWNISILAAHVMRVQTWENLIFTLVWMKRKFILWIKFIQIWTNPEKETDYWLLTASWSRCSWSRWLHCKKIKLRKLKCLRQPASAEFLVFSTSFCRFGVFLNLLLYKLKTTSWENSKICWSWLP